MPLVAGPADAPPAPVFRESAIVGSSLPRREDRRLVAGRGEYVGDMRLPGMVEAAVLRSPVAHAEISHLDTSACRDMDGVVAVYTAKDLAGRVAPMVESALREVSPVLAEKIGLELRACPMPVLAEGCVHWVGQPVAVVVAANRYLAEDALERIDVDYEPLPTVVDPEAALASDAPILHPEVGSNVVAHFAVTNGDVDRAFAEADHSLSRRFRMGRQLANAMETRGILAVHEPRRDEVTVWAANARPYLVRAFVSEMLGRPAESVHVIAPDMGGSFGTGMFTEDVLVPFLAIELGRPVRWIEDRQEALANTRHARDQLHDLEVAFTADGRIVALRDRFLVDCGAYNPYAITVSYNSAAHLRGQFRIDTFAIEGSNVLTNKAPVTPVRGAGRPEATFAMDRMIDLVAATVGLDPAEVRRRNLVPADAMPYPMGMPYRDGVDMVYDSGNFTEQLDRALEAFGYEEFRATQAEERERGRWLGVGMSSFVEGSGYGPHEGAVVRVDATGHVVVLTGATPHGQGHATTLAQVCADQLGVRPEDVSVKAGDTALIAHGIGTFASRSAVTAGSAVAEASRQVREKALGVAGEMLETDPADLELEEGSVFMRGAPDRSVTLAEVAKAAAPGPHARLPAGAAPGLEATYYYVPPTVTFGSGTHVVLVEVDPETGSVRPLRYVSVDDCGQMLNPMIVEGQIHGGISHGIGNALYEESVYDEYGNLLTGTYMDYLMPSAAEVPPIELHHQEYLSPRNPLGIKGVGEGGAVSPPAAIANAVVDALRPLGVEVNRVPLHPEPLLRLVEEATAQEDGT